MGRITETVKILLITNVIFFIGTMIIGEPAYRLFSLYFFKNDNFHVWQILTHMFMHGGFMHIFFNMYALWAFGSPIEQMLGQKRFVFFYFSAGIGAAVLHSLVNYYHFEVDYNALLDAGMNHQGHSEIAEYRGIFHEYIKFGSQGYPAGPVYEL